MQADRKVYTQAVKDGWLKHKLRVGEVSYEGGNSLIAPAFKEAKTALEDSLAIGGYIADEGKAQYRLSAVIRNAESPVCFMATCETGSAIDYTLTEIRSENIVYNDLLVVPYTSEYPLLTSDINTVRREALGGAIGENFAHLIHVLSEKKPADLREAL